MTDAHLPLPAARRAALILAISNAIGGSAGPVSIGTGGLPGPAIRPPDQSGRAPVPVTPFVVGTTIASIPAALLMRRIGRRNGFIFGLVLGAIGAVAAALVILAHSFVGFAFTQVLVGAAGAFL